MNCPRSPRRLASEPGCDTLAHLPALQASGAGAVGAAGAAGAGMHCGELRPDEGKGSLPCQHRLLLREVIPP